MRGLNVQRKNVGATLTGIHASGETDNRTELIQFKNGAMIYLLDGIGNIFPNLKSILIGLPDSPSLSTKLIRRSNFQNMKNLFEFVIHKSDIETVDEDTLWDLPNLERFQLGNNLKLLQERTFEKNTKLREVYLASNRLEFLPRHLFKNNLLLDWVNFEDNSLKIIEIDFSILKNIRYIFFADNVCINENYNGTEDRNITVLYPLRKIVIFQLSIKTNCSSS